MVTCCRKNTRSQHPHERTVRSFAVRRGAVLPRHYITIGGYPSFCPEERWPEAARYGVLVLALGEPWKVAQTLTGFFFVYIYNTQADGQKGKQKTTRIDKGGKNYLPVTISTLLKVCPCKGNYKLATGPRVEGIRSVIESNLQILYWQGRESGYLLDEVEHEFGTSPATMSLWYDTNLRR